MSPKACVIGWPARHSRSPLIHGYWLERYGLPGAYEIAEVSPDDFPGFVGTLAERGFVGANVTVPHKEAAFRLLGHAHPSAERLGAANTLWFEGGRLHGANTDVTGFVASLDAGAPGWDRDLASAVVIGAGGAARALVAGLLDRAIGTVHVVNRSPGRAEDLERLFGPRVRAHRPGELPPLLAEAGLLVNATSLGMLGEPPLDVDLAPLRPGCLVTDIVYAPLETPLLAAARARGHPVVDGLGMLLHQAAPGFERWFGHRPEVTPGLRARIVAALEAEALMLVLGLTGSIGMGKSVTARLFAERGCAVYDADLAVHALYSGEIAGLIEEAFPGSTRNGAVDRAALSRQVLGDRAALARLESIVHPLVREAERKFLADATARGVRTVVLEIPLLLERERGGDVDAVVVASAPTDVQRERVLARPGMTEEKLRHILARQMPDSDKRARAHFVVDTGRGMEPARRSVGGILRALAGHPGRRRGN